MASAKKMKTSDMDQETAQVLFDQGATFVFLDVPEGTEFGIDYNSWNVGPNFRGVKMIPPGIHFVYYSATSSSRDAAPRTGFFHNFKAKEILIKTWDKFLEDIKSGPASAEEQQRIQDNKQELDRYFGVYPYDSFKKWVSLTSHITIDLLEKVHPLDGKISAVTAFLSERSNTKQRREAAEARKHEHSKSDESQSGEEARLPHMDVIPGTEIRFTQIPKQKYPPGASAAEITRCNMDHSYVLQTLLDTVYKDNQCEILGELQFAFICFLIGQVYDAFEQWKRLVHLLCSCDQALSNHSNLFIQFISTLYYQVHEIPKTFSWT